MSVYRLAIRRLRKEWIHTSVHVLGLSIGLAAAILAAVYVWYETRYDQHLSESDQVFRVIRNENPRTPIPFAEALEASVASKLDITRILPTLGDVLIRSDSITYYEKAFFFADAGFQDVFGYREIIGDLSRLGEVDAIAISASIAAKYFGNEDPMGRLLTFDVGTKLELSVVGVYADPPSDSHFRPDFLGSLAGFESLGFLDFAEWQNNIVFSYLNIEHPRINETAIQKESLRLLKQFSTDADQDVQLQPIRSIHLGPAFDGDLAKVGSQKQVWAIGLAGLLVLVLACINFINLSLAKQLRQRRQVGVLKAFGASWKDIARQLITEAIVLGLLSSIISAIVVILTLPFLESLTRTEMGARFHISVLLSALVLTGLGCAIISCIYPVWSQTRMRTILLITGRNDSGGKSNSGLQDALVVAQFFVAMTIVSCTLLIQKQISFAMSRDAGIPSDQLLILNARTYGHGQEPISFDALTERLGLISGVEAVSAAGDVPGRQPRRFQYLPEEQPQSELSDQHYFERISADSLGLEVLEVELLSGQSLAATSSNSVLINQKASAHLKLLMGDSWSDPVGKKLKRYLPIGGTERYVGSVEIAGVVDDFQYSSLKSPIQPMIIDQNPTNFDNVIMRIAPNSAASVLRDAAKVWSEVAPDRPFDFSFLDDQFASEFGTDEIIRTLLGILGAFSMLIGVVGLFALTSLSVELRKGEMAIRKSLGASSQSIFGLLASDSIKLIGFALLGAIPVTLVLISRWLESFPFVAPFSPISFLIAGVGTVVLALLTISFNLIKVAVRPVIETIRNSE